MSDSADRRRPGRIHTTRQRTATAGLLPGDAGLGMLVFEDAQLVAALALAEGELLVGRAPGCALRLRDPEISRRHCLITRRGDATTLRDLGSVNGTFLHGRRVAAARLAGGDVVTLGQVLLKFLRLDSPEWSVQCALFEQIHRDELTGLLNRRGLRLRADAALATLASGAPVALLMVDVDGFKQVNDRFGHPAGDQAIRHVGLQLAAALPAGAIAARLGGEEFAVLLVDSEAAVPADVAERMRAAVVAWPLRLEGSAVPLTVSVGVARAVTPLAALRPLVVRADQALYEAKAAGRNRCVVAEEVIGAFRADLA